MPKGIKKPTEKSLREAIEKQERAIHDKELALTKAKADYDAKLKCLKNEIAAGKTNLTKLRKEYDDFIRNEQQATLSTMLFNSDLSSAEVSRAINAMKMLLDEHADHEKAIGILQKIADEHQNSTITNLVSEIGLETQQKPESAVGVPGVSPTAAEQET